MLHALPYHNPLVLASAIAATDILTGGRYEFGVGTRPRLDPDEGRRAARRGCPAALRGGRRSALQGARQRALLALTARTSTSTTRTSSRSRRASSASTSGGTSDRTYELAAENGWGVAVPPLLPYVALQQQLDLYRAECARHGTTPDIVWIHACHLDNDRDTAMREAREWVPGFIQGNCSPLHRVRRSRPPTISSRPATASTRPASWSRSRPCRSSSSSRTTTSGSARRRTSSSASRDARAVRGCHGDRHHRQRGRRTALDGDQEPGAVRARRDAARLSARRQARSRAHAQARTVVAPP